jgi:hypothetical protein
MVVPTTLDASKGSKIIFDLKIRQDMLKFVSVTVFSECALFH